MKIQFEDKQQYQLDAINSVVQIFEGEGLISNDERTMTEEDPGALALAYKIVANRSVLTDQAILNNLRRVQEDNSISQDEALAFVSYETEEEETNFTYYPNLTVEMETGTGKTYVYLRTIYELNEKYGWKKFIVVVPGVAIREGVLKNLQITHDHFQKIYRNEPISFNVYDSKKLGRLKEFAENAAIQVLVITIDSFTGDQNIINQSREKGIKPLEYLQGTSPVVILDEPQRMETDTRKRAISSLNPLAVLRYSATHKNPYNVIYKLTPVDAYDLGLVKQIEVESVLAENGESGAYLKLSDFKVAKKSISGKLEILKKSGSTVVKKGITVRAGDDLFVKSGGVEMYREGFVVNFVDADEGLIEFSNQPTLYQGHSQGAMTEELQKEMIAATIENHLKKEAKYKSKGIKVLSVFFLDVVANYRTYGEEGIGLGKFGQWFEEIMEKKLENPKYKSLYPFNIAQLHNGYFSQDKTSYSPFESVKNSTKGGAEDTTFNLIMKDKEKLLSNETPLRFIFSHSALREGWDNPNVFQICTLNDTKTEDRKRQEIGRGLRLSVNQEGERIRDPQINVLTVIVNESYDHFAKTLQKEIEDETGVEFKGRIKNTRDRVTVKLKKGWQLDQHFLDLWNRIKHKTKYNVDYDSEELVRDAAKSVKGMQEVRAPIIRRVRTYLTFDRNEDMTLSDIGGEVKSSPKAKKVDAKYQIPDIVAQIQSETELTRAAVTNILIDSGRLQDAFQNPQMFVDLATKAINSVFRKMKVEGIKYEKIADDWYSMELFEGKEIETYIDNLISVDDQEKTLYDHIVIDSLSTPESNFAKECETRDDVLFYVKLPSWFNIKTPIGPYNPDWALIKQEDGEQKKLYFVAETKSPEAIKDRSKLRESELLKIHCGEKHFELFEDVTFKPVGTLGDL
jgi:type III restriction enzyme